MNFFRIIIIIFIFLHCFLHADKDMKITNVSAALQEECSSSVLEINGTIPTWLSGTLVRNGPINVKVGEETNAHWFDGLAMLHAFSFLDGQVKYANKFLRSDAYHEVFDNGSLRYAGFASDPCRSIFKKFLTFFVPQKHTIRNANINVAKMANEYVALTEVPLPVKFDLQTLETLGVLEFDDALPKEKCWESAHPHVDESMRVINYLIEYGRTCYYTLYSMEKEGLQRKVIARVPVKNPAYMHSFAVTENYLILTEFPFLVKPLDLITKNQAFIKNFTWQPEKGTRFIVLDREKGNVISTFTTKPFFAFHHANAFEKEGSIYVDIVTYEDAHIITGEGFYNVDTAKKNPHPSRLERFSLSLDSGHIHSEIIMSCSNEFPRINEKYDGQPYRYLYVACFDDDKIDSKGLAKVDMETKNKVEWAEEGCSPGEPVFVALPGSHEEDQGIILAVVLDHQHGGSFLLLLDAKNFTEIGRARAPHLIPNGLHGQYFY